MGELTPFGLLVEIAERGRRVTVELPAAGATKTRWTGIGFNLLGQRFVARMDEVAEVMRVPQTTRLPGVKPFVYGISNIRGRLMPVLDLAMFVGGASEVARANRRILAVDSEDSFIGFMIDESLGMQHFPADAWEDGDEDVEDAFRPYVRGSYRVAGSAWPVLSLKALAEHPGLQKLAAGF